MNTKTAKEERARGNLQGIAWAKPLLATLEGQFGSEGFLFELRFAHEIARASVTPKYEHKTGEGNSTVDFCLSSGAVQWHVELVTVETSAAVTDAAVRELIGPGIEVETTVLGRGASRVDGVPLTSKQAPEAPGFARGARSAPRPALSALHSGGAARSLRPGGCARHAAGAGGSDAFFFVSQSQIASSP